MLKEAFRQKGLYVQGNAGFLPLRPNRFDYAIVECALSPFDNQVKCLRNIWLALRDGGKIAMTDMLIEEELPTDFAGAVGQIACLAAAHSAEGYTQLLADAGFMGVAFEDHSDSLVKMVHDIRRKIFAMELMDKLRPQPFTNEIDFDRARTLIDKSLELLGKGKLGYGAFIAEK